jgi:hypothetical protein
MGVLVIEIVVLLLNASKPMYTIGIRFDVQLKDAGSLLIYLFEYRSGNTGVDSHMVIAVDVFDNSDFLSFGRTLNLDPGLWRWD